MILPLLWLSLSFIAGIILASQIVLSTSIWLGLAIVMAVVVFGTSLVLRLRKVEHSLTRTPYLLAGLAVMSLFLGATRYQWVQPEMAPDFIAWYNDRQYDLLVTGRLAEAPDYRDTYTNLVLIAQRVNTGKGNRPVSGRLLVRVSPGDLYHYGDQVRLRGRLETPPENEEFSYRDYLATQGIHSFMSNPEVTRLPFEKANPMLAALYTFKDHTLANIYRLYPDPEASLLAGILLGVDTGLPADLQQAFKNTGTAHIIAISGFNITIIAGLFVTFFSRFLGQRRGAIIAILGIAMYTVLVGGEAAVVRAAIMGGLALFARQLGRRQDGLNTLAVTAASMAVINPFVLQDVGFQLSFFATLGLILYAQPLHDWTVRKISRLTSLDLAKKIAQPLSEFVLLTLAAQLTTLPIMAYHFKRISLVSLIANPFILPVQPAVMIVGGLAVILSLIYFPLGQVAAWFAWPFSAYTIRVVELFDKLPHGVIVLGDMSLLFVILFYAVLFIWTFGGSRLKTWTASRLESRPSSYAVWSAAILGLLTILVWRSVLTLPDHKLHLTFLDVGSGDAVLIQTPDGEHVLVNGGPSAIQLSDALGRRLPVFNRDLDWLVVASTQENQVAALPRTLERFFPANVLWSGNVEASYPARQLDQWLSQQAIPIVEAEPEQTLDLGQGATLEVVTVTSRGAVLLVEWGDFRALLPVGNNFDGLVELNDGQAIGPVSVLSLADSGYAAVNPVEWITNLNPDLVVLSVAAGDRNGLPQEKTLEAVGDYPLLRTDRYGWIDVATDGQKMWVDVEKNKSIESLPTGE